jgi:hypothetical protein
MYLIIHFNPGATWLFMVYLAHASHLQRAEDLINTMSGELNAGVWMVLLGASRIHGDTELG